MALPATTHPFLKSGSPPHFSSAKACGSLLFVCNLPPQELLSAASGAAICRRSCHL